MKFPSNFPGLIIAFMTGFLIGFLIFYIFVGVDYPDKSENYNFFGLMGKFEAPAGFSKADEVQFDGEEIKLDLSTQYDKNIVIAEVEVDSKEDVKLLLNYDKNYLRFYGKRFIENMNDTRVVLSENSVLFNSKGLNKILLFFQNNSETEQKIHIQIYKGYNIIYENSVITNK